MPHQMINCQVHTCRYNDQVHSCTLNDIVVGNSAQAPHEKSDTECASFETNA